MVGRTVAGARPGELTRTVLPRVGWTLAFVLATVAVGASLIRYALPEAAHQQLVRPLYGDDFTDHQIPRYGAHPVTTFLHVVVGSFVIISGLLQLSSKLRRRRPRLHRLLGQAHIVAALCAGGSAVAVLWVFPFAGLNEVVPVTFFLVIYVYSLVAGFVAARERRYLEHREWMMRSMGISLGVAAVRLIFVAFLHTVHATQYENFGVSMWAGFGVSLLVAEVWVQHTRGDRSIVFDGAEPIPEPVRPTAGDAELAPDAAAVARRRVG